MGIEIDVQTLLLAAGVFILVCTFGFIWAVHRGWLSA